MRAKFIKNKTSILENKLPLKKESVKRTSNEFTLKITNNGKILNEKKSLEINFNKNSQINNDERKNLIIINKINRPTRPKSTKCFKPE